VHRLNSGRLTLPAAFDDVGWGERESGTGRLGEAVIAYREALKERTRDRVPLHWAATQNNLGPSKGSVQALRGKGPSLLYWLPSLTYMVHSENLTPVGDV
jgi:hypothetical protein